MVNPDKPLVLLVDDNEPTCTLITALLKRDFEVDVATDGTEALEKLRTKSYAGMILDLLMPNLDGFGVLDFVRGNNTDMLRRIIIVTAALSKSEVGRVKDYGVCAIIAKPFDVETLLSSVKQCTDESTPMRGSILSSGVLLLLADLLRQRLM